MTDERTAHESANDIREQLHSKPEWEIADWTYTEEMYDGTTITVELEYVGLEGGNVDEVEVGTSTEQRDRIKDLLAVIKKLEQQHSEGAPVEAVIEECVEYGMDAKTAGDEIESLKQKGEVYEPRTDHLRST